MVPFSPRPIPVTDKMIAVDQMYFKDAATGSLDQILLMALVKDMNERNVSRLPILDDRHPHSIVHKATINEFMVQAIERGTVAELTLHDLLTQHADALEGSYAEVSTTATIEEAMEAMAAKPGWQMCTSRWPFVVGWLPNVFFDQDQAPAKSSADADQRREPPLRQPASRRSSRSACPATESSPGARSSTAQGRLGRSLRRGLLTCSVGSPLIGSSPTPDGKARAPAAA